MGAIPSSDLPGHQKLHERAVGALDLCQESRSIDFKQSESWENLKIKIIKTAMAMGNLQDGGIIIIGVSEDGGNWKLTGIKESDLNTYDIDIILDAINAYASPPMKIDIVKVRYTDGNDYLAIHVHEFVDTPIVCKRDAPGNSNEFKNGEIYIRPAGGRPRTSKIQSADDLHDMLELAAEKKARAIIEKSKRVGLEPIATVADKFNEELEGL